MKIIFLNIWFGQGGEPFFNFIKQKSSETDIFCFMEVTPNLYKKLSEDLKDFQSIYDKGTYLKELEDWCGQSIFVNKNLKINSKGKTLIYPQSDDDIGFLQYVQIDGNNGSFWIGNVHGKTKPGDKLDTPIRISQSKKIIEFFNKKSGGKIIGGDFNLYPETKSVKMFEEAGYKNLIREFDIKTTRNQTSWNQFANHPGYVKQYFADFTFVSPEIKVKNFEVPNLEISDHLPQILEFSFDSFDSTQDESAQD